METETLPTAQEDLATICASVAANRPVDPEVAKRVRERTEQIQQRLTGMKDISVALIREARDE